MAGTRKPRRNDRRVVIHFVSFKPTRLSLSLAFRRVSAISNAAKGLTNVKDYDCFYASVFEHENPALKSLPLVSAPPVAPVAALIPRLLRTQG
jgi:hypothetical protein